MYTQIKLNESQKKEISSFIHNEIYDIESNQTELFNTRKKAIEAYRSKWPEPTDVGSSYVSPDVKNAINQLLPEIVKIFVANKNPVEFTTTDDENIEVAKVVTEYVSRSYDNSQGFLVLTTALRNGLLLGTGFIKTEWVEKETFYYESYNGLTDDEFISLNGQQNIEIDGAGERDEQNLISVKVKRIEKEENLNFTSPPPENILISAERSDIDKCRFVAERSRKTKSELLELGFDKDLVESLPTTDEDTSDTLDYVRDDTQELSSTNDNEVDYYECYIKYDLNDNGQSENLKICCAGDSYTILGSYNYNILPYSLWSPILIANSLYGESLAEQLFSTQELKTTLQRQINNAVYLNNFPTEFVFPELLTPEGIKQLQEPQIGQKINSKLHNGQAINPSIQAITQANIGESFSLLQKLDEDKTNIIGINPVSQAISDGVIAKSATEVAVNANQAHTQLVSFIRNFAEFALKPAFEKALHLSLFYDDSNLTYRVDDFNIQINVGLGANDNARKLQSMMLISQQQDKLVQQYGNDSPFITQANLLATNNAIAELSGIENPDLYIPKPSEDEVAQWQQEQQQGVMDSEQQALMAEQQASMAQQQAQAEIEQSKLQVRMAEIELKREQLAFDIQKHQNEMELERQKIAVNSDIELTKLEVESELKAEELDAEKELKKAKIETGKATSTNIGIN